MSFRINKDRAAASQTLRQAVENQRNLGERPVDITTRSATSQLKPDDRFAGDIWDPESRVGITGEFGKAANTVAGPEASEVAQNKLKQFMEMFMSNSLNVENFNPDLGMGAPAPAPIPNEEPIV